MNASTLSRFYASTQKEKTDEGRKNDTQKSDP